MSQVAQAAAKTETADDRVNVLIRVLKNAEVAYQATKADWLVKLESYPTEAMEWSEGMFSSATKAKVHNRFLMYVEREIADGEMAYETMIGHIKSDLTETVLYAAQHPKRSTSAVANLTAQYELAAAAELLSTLSKSRYL
jgi:hypothetical protein